jgi:DNA-binding response OmpR family regulator
LAITASLCEQNTIRVIAVTHGWKLLLADSVRSALSILAVEPVPLILYDRDLPGIEWQDMFRILLTAREPQCVILVSPVTDDYLWQAVIERGGYDIVTKPFQEDKVVNVVRSASLYQKTGWTQPPRSVR